MPDLQELYSTYGQSVWLDNLRRDWLRNGEIRRWIDLGVRGITSNPSIFANAMRGAEYDEDLARLAAEGRSVEDCYWQLVITDIAAALDQLEGVHRDSNGDDGFVSVEVSPRLADRTEATIEAAHWLVQALPAPNLMIKVPATIEGLPAITALTAAGISVNVTLIFTLERYAQVIDAYLSGLEQRDGDISGIHSVASFFISRVDTAIDPALEALGAAGAHLVGRSAVNQAKLAYALAAEHFSSERFARLAERGANAQRPLWASTSTKNPAYPDTMYVDELIGPGTVNTIPDATLGAFLDHGTIADALGRGTDRARSEWKQLSELVDLAAIGRQLESEGVAAFVASFDSLLDELAERIDGND